jgi:exodeoxyribonuclease X
MKQRTFIHCTASEERAQDSSRAMNEGLQTCGPRRSTKMRMKDKTMRIRVVDLETTGFTPPDHAPCEIGFVDLISSGTNLAGEPSFWEIDLQISIDMLCHPGRSIPPNTSAVHHIIDEDVQGARPWQDALRYIADPKFGPKPDIFAAHNAKFERQWITDAITHCAPWICTYKAALRIWPEAPLHSNQGLRYWRRPVGLDRKLADRAHRALPDAYVTALLLREMLDETPSGKLIEWSDQPAILIRVPFGKSRGMLWKDVDAGFLEWVLNRDFDEDILFTAKTEWEERFGNTKKDEQEDEWL